MSRTVMYKDEEEGIIVKCYSYYYYQLLAIIVPQAIKPQITLALHFDGYVSYYFSHQV